MTSLLAIAALTAGKFLGWTWMDALTGILGSIVIARWSLGLLRDTSAVLLDAEVPDQRRREIQAAIEADRTTGSRTFTSGAWDGATWQPSSRS